jgi:serine/threonine protein kinase
MMNEDNERTLVRTRKLASDATRSGTTELSVNVLPIGTKLGEFEILDLIGEGGFGIVYLAYDHSLERRVALKEYMPSGLATRTTKMMVTVRSQHNADTFTVGLKSFVNEARMLAQFDSPALVKVHRFWEGNGTAYMVMPFYEGITLKQAFREHRITPTEKWIRVLLADMFDAIETIHRAQCFHRDIAPDNILLLKDGRPLLLDFGAARRVIGDLTQCLTVILKPGFAPIEQYADIASLRQGAWTDVYALAAVVYYLIAGKAPPPAVARMVHDEMVPAQEVGKGRYSNAFLAVLDKALSVKPEQRYRSIAELRRALDIMETTPRTLPPTATNQASGSAGSEITVPMAAAMAPAMPPAKSRPDPQAKPYQPPHGKPAAKQHTMPDATNATVNPNAKTRPVARPSEKTEVRPRTEPSMGPAPYAARTNDSPRGSGAPRAATPATTVARPRRMKPEWVIPGILLMAGIASGVYVGQAPRWKEGAAPAATSGESTVMSSSGSSDAPEQEPPQQAAAPTRPNAPATAPSALAREPAAEASLTPRTTPPAATAAAPATPSKEAPAANAPSAQSASPVQRLSPEEELWQNASKSDKSRAYEKYLKEYPRGRYAAVARLRLEEKLPKPAAGSPATALQDAKSAKEQKSASAAAADDEVWSMASTINEAPAYEAYLHKYPKGRHAQDAKAKLTGAKLKEEPAQAATKTPAPEATAEREPPAATDKLTSVKPSEASVPAPKQPAPQATPKPSAETTVPSARKTLKLDNQTMTGDFSSDPQTGIVSGTGKIVWSNGNQFDGTLVNGLKEGKGKFNWSNGQSYNGEWAHDMPNGKGLLVFPDGGRYEGEVKNGVPHGQGVTRFKSGDVHSGSSVNGKRQGHGRYTWTNGSYWEGEFKDDRMTDNGKMVFSESALRAANAHAASGGGTPQAGHAAADK